MDVPDIRYARSGDVAIAYQVVGDGDHDLVFLPFLGNIWSFWRMYRFAEFGHKLAEGRRLIVVNPRGVGLSDRPRGFTIESRMDDITAVMDALEIDEPPCSGSASPPRPVPCSRRRIPSASTGSSSSLGTSAVSRTTTSAPRFRADPLRARAVG